MAKRRWIVLGIGAAIVAGTAAAVSWFRSELAPTPAGSPFYVRFEKPTPLRDALVEIEKKGAIKSATVFRWYSVMRKHTQSVRAGTYQFTPGSGADAVLAQFDKPIRWMVRVPEQNWALRTANLLEKKEILRADDYMALVRQPDAFRAKVSFPIEGETLEGYLFPDTYAMAPLMPAEELIGRQLAAFQKKVWEGLAKPANLHRILTIASIIELEVARDEERPIVAGVIENRLAKGMKLDMDATVCYARQKWGALTRHDLVSIVSPYNTYLNKGLPPGPICSPSIKSIKAAMAPSKHEFLYYVAMPDGHQLFSKTLPEQEHNIRLRKLALAQAKSKSAAAAPAAAAKPTP